MAIQVPQPRFDGAARVSATMADTLQSAQRTLGAAGRLSQRMGEVEDRARLRQDNIVGLGVYEDFRVEAARRLGEFANDPESYTDDAVRTFHASLDQLASDSMSRASFHFPNAADAVGEKMRKKIGELVIEAGGTARDNGVKMAGLALQRGNNERLAVARHDPSQVYELLGQMREDVHDISESLGPNAAETYNFFARQIIESAAYSFANRGEYVQARALLRSSDAVEADDGRWLKGQIATIDVAIKKSVADRGQASVDAATIQARLASARLDNARAHLDELKARAEKRWQDVKEGKVEPSDAEQREIDAEELKLEQARAEVAAAELANAQAAIDAAMTAREFNNQSIARANNAANAQRTIGHIVKTYADEFAEGRYPREAMEQLVDAQQMFMKNTAGGVEPRGMPSMEVDRVFRAAGFRVNWKTLFASTEQYGVLMDGIARLPSVNEGGAENMGVTLAVDTMTQVANAYIAQVAGAAPAPAPAAPAPAPAAPAPAAAAPAPAPAPAAPAPGAPAPGAPAGAPGAPAPAAPAPGAPAPGAPAPPGAPAGAPPGAPAPAGAPPGAPAAAAAAAPGAGAEDTGAQAIREAETPEAVRAVPSDARIVTPAVGQVLEESQDRFPPVEDSEDNPEAAAKEILRIGSDPATQQQAQADLDAMYDMGLNLYDNADNVAGVYNAMTRALHAFAPLEGMAGEGADVKARARERYRAVQQRFIVAMMPFMNGRMSVELQRWLASETTWMSPSIFTSADALRVSLEDTAVKLADWYRMHKRALDMHNEGRLVPDEEVAQAEGGMVTMRTLFKVLGAPFVVTADDKDNPTEQEQEEVAATIEEYINIGFLRSGDRVRAFGRDLTIN